MCLVDAWTHLAILLRMLMAYTSIRYHILSSGQYNCTHQLQSYSRLWAHHLTPVNDHTASSNTHLSLTSLQGRGYVCVGQQSACWQRRVCCLCIASSIALLNLRDGMPGKAVAQFRLTRKQELHETEVSWQKIRSKFGTLLGSKLCRNMSLRRTVSARFLLEWLLILFGLLALPVMISYRVDTELMLRNNLNLHQQAEAQVVCLMICFVVRPVPQSPGSIVQLGAIVKGYRYQPGIRMHSYKGEPVFPNHSIPCEVDSYSNETHLLEGSSGASATISVDQVGQNATT